MHAELEEQAQSFAELAEAFRLAITLHWVGVPFRERYLC